MYACTDVCTFMCLAGVVVVEAIATVIAIDGAIVTVISVAILELFLLL